LLKDLKEIQDTKLILNLSGGEVQRIISIYPWII